MKEIKPALTALEQAILKLESAIYASKKSQTVLTEQVDTLKQAVRTTYDRLDKAIETYRKETE